MVRIYFVRHGESEVNITKEFSYKRVDKPLTAKGRAQAKQAGEYFARHQVDAIYSSPLIRAQQTAEIIRDFLATAPPLPIQTWEEFREINVGDLEAMPPSDAAWGAFFEVWDQWKAGRPEARFPHGEDRHELMGRMQHGIRRILSDPKVHSAIVVAHGGIMMNGLPPLLMNLTFEDLGQKDWPNAGITIAEFVLERGVPVGKLVAYGLTAHLHGEASKQVSGVPDRKGPKWSDPN